MIYIDEGGSIDAVCSREEARELRDILAYYGHSIQGNKLPYNLVGFFKGPEHAFLILPKYWKAAAGTSEIEQATLGKFSDLVNFFSRVIEYEKWLMSERTGVGGNLDQELTFFDYTIAVLLERLTLFLEQYFQATFISLEEDSYSVRGRVDWSKSDGRIIPIACEIPSATFNHPVNQFCHHFAQIANKILISNPDPKSALYVRQRDALKRIFAMVSEVPLTTEVEECWLQVQQFLDTDKFTGHTDLMNDLWLFLQRLIVSKEEKIYFSFSFDMDVYFERFVEELCLNSGFLVERQVRYDLLGSATWIGKTRPYKASFSSIPDLVLRKSDEQSVQIIADCKYKLFSGGKSDGGQLVDTNRNDRNQSITALLSYLFTEAPSTLPALLVFYTFTDENINDPQIYTLEFARTHLSCSGLNFRKRDDGGVGSPLRIHFVPIRISKLINKTSRDEEKAKFKYLVDEVLRHGQSTTLGVNDASHSRSIKPNL